MLKINPIYRNSFVLRWRRRRRREITIIIELVRRKKKRKKDFTFSLFFFQIFNRFSFFWKPNSSEIFFHLFVKKKIGGINSLCGEAVVPLTFLRWVFLYHNVWGKGIPHKKMFSVCPLKTELVRNMRKTDCLLDWKRNTISWDDFW